MSVVSVVIPTCNRVQSLKYCLHALERQTVPLDFFEIIVVDDGSEDETQDFIQTFSQICKRKVIYYRQNNSGPSFARNCGIRHASGKLIAFTDDDCLPTAAWLEELISALPNDKKCAGVGGKIVRKRNSLISRYIDDAGAMEHKEKHNQVQYLVTANALFRASTLDEVGGFDTKITWPGGEDPDLSFRFPSAVLLFSL